MLWRALEVREVQQIGVHTLQASDAQRSALHTAIRNSGQAMARASERRVAGATLPVREADLMSLTRDLPGLEGGAWVARDGHVEERYPLAFDVAGVDSVWRPYLSTDSLVYVPLDAKAARFAIVAPTCQRGECDGAMVGILRVDRLFASVLGDSLTGFHYGLATTEGRVPGSDWPDVDFVQWTITQPVAIGNIRFNLSTWPTQATLDRGQTRLPLMTLLMGAIVSGLLPFTTLLGQRDKRAGRRHEKARLASVLERATGGIWEWDLSSGAADHSAGIWQSLGYEVSSEDAHRGAWMVLIHPDDVDSFARALKRHLEGHSETFELEYRVCDARGAWHTMVDRARIVERTPVPVVPLALSGLWQSVFARSRGTFRRGLWVFRRIRLAIGERIAAAEVTPEALRAAVLALRGDWK
jgi:PAS domain-containing protein